LALQYARGDGVAGVSGSAGEFMWAGYAGTYFWVDPKEEVVGVYMTQARRVLDGRAMPAAD
jgi:CubicO group peptidase (beta-lactamase class C family)